MIDLPENGDHDCNEPAAQQPTVVNCELRLSVT
jgi:hypothetical protein